MDVARFPFQPRFSGSFPVMEMLIMKAFFFLAALVAMNVASAAQAQYGYPSYHASTAGEGYARGMADVVRSRGEANVMNS
ncbi:MAG TPA: hypothetical protein DD670_13320 [Planctomycetaceae bacterium]|nr:hypothetical protein [Planctomycetaceae bacterium]